MLSKIVVINSNTLLKSLGPTYSKAWSLCFATIVGNPWIFHSFTFSESFSLSNFMKLYLNNENFVLVGEWARYISTQSKTEPNSVIQIISENNIEMDYSNIVRYISKFTPYGVFYKKRKMYIPKNNRILKYTIYIKYPTIKSSTIDKPIMDIYNCASYEVIPYINKKHKNFWILQHKLKKNF